MEVLGTDMKPNRWGRHAIFLGSLKRDQFGDKARWENIKKYNERMWTGLNWKEKKNIYIYIYILQKGGSEQQLVP
jgi:hypothetical protein